MSIQIASFIKDYLSVYSNLLEEVLKEVLFNYIASGGHLLTHPGSPAVRDNQS